MLLFSSSMNRSIFLFLLILGSMNSMGQSDTLVDKYFRTYTAFRTDNPPRIDGILKDVCWNEGIWHSDFTQQQPYGGAKASYPTEIKVLYDRDYLYVGIRCKDGEPEKIRRIFNRRDNFSGDVTGIALDTYHDRQTAFEFNLTAAGQKIDLKHKGNFQFDQNWNAVWDGKTALEDSAWTAEMRIPFSQLRYNDKEEQVWGMHIWRWLDRKNEESQWKLIPLNSPAMVYLFGELNGIHDIRASRQIELLPFVSGKYMPARGDRVNVYGNTREWFPNAGLDAKIGLSSNITLDATINPDFGQVEADPSVLNLTSFETFYDEKRPFFLEGAEIFDYTLDDDRLFYSRRIGQSPSFLPDISADHYMDSPENSTIIGAAKITGRTSSGLALGILESLTAAEQATVYYPNDIRHDTLVAPFTNYLVARLLQEKNNSNTMFGGIFSMTKKSVDNEMLSLTNREAYSGGLDFVQNWKEKMYYLEGKGLISYQKGSADAIQALQESPVHLFQRTDAGHLSFDTTRTELAGTGGYIAVGKKGGNFRFSEKVKWQSPGFELNDIGYLREADNIGQRSDLSYWDIEPGKLFRSQKYFIYQSNSYSFGGELSDAIMGSGVELGFKNLWGTYADLNYSFPSFETRELRGGPALWVNPYLNFGWHLNSNYARNFAGTFGTHHTFAQRENSENHVYHIEFTWHPISRINLSAYSMYIKNLDQFQYIQTVESPQIRYLMGSLKQQTLQLTFRAEVFFTPEISLQYYGSPYFSVGQFTDFYYVDRAGSKENESRYYKFTEEEITYNPDENSYVLEEAAGPTYTIDNPDFIFAQFRSNFVFRWEYKLGSVFYFVWSHNKDLSNNVHSPTLSEGLQDLNQATGGNIIMVKLNYWFSL
jgi:hypothetical protein